MDNNQLYHWGIKGMKWGIRRYQNKDGSLTAKGRQRYAKLEDELNKLKPSNDEQESYETRKQRAVKSGSATEVLRYKGDLTQQEMQSAATRIRWEQEMKQISDKELAPGKSKVDKVMDAFGKVTDYAITGAKAYNMFANVYNAFGKGAVRLPKIDTDVIKGNREARKQEQAKQQAAEEAERKRREEYDQEQARKKQEQQESNAKKRSDNVEKVDAEFVGNRSDRNRDPIDAEYRDIPINDVGASQYTSAGRATVAGLLEAPKELVIKKRRRY